MFTIHETGLPDCIELRAIRRQDKRGAFVKTMHADYFRAHGIETDFKEAFYSHSTENVLRGLHFQRPPAAQAKLVYCIRGAVDDAVLDLRVGSPTFGKHVVVRLEAELANQLYIPVGFAHGFHVPHGDALMMYHVTTVHVPELDGGVRWDSARIPWRTTSPITSERDAALPTLAEFASPFVFEVGA